MFEQVGYSFIFTIRLKYWEDQGQYWFSFSTEV